MKREFFITMRSKQNKPVFHLKVKLGVGVEKKSSNEFLSEQTFNKINWKQQSVKASQLFKRKGAIFHQDDTRLFF